MFEFFNSLFNRQPEKVKAKVEIYTWAICPYCIRAKLLLWWKGVNFTEYKIDGDNVAREQMSQRANGGRSVPQIFVNNQHLGGCDDIHELNARGQLDSLLAQVPG